MAKSFYELDYIIEVSEKRLAEYTLSYQKVLERLTNIIIIYSALGIFLVPLTHHALEMDIRGWVFYTAVYTYGVLLLISVVYMIRLLLPVEIAYLEPPKKYYNEFKSQIEALNTGNQQLVDDSLKGAYILELEDAIEINRQVFEQKSSFFYNALLFALLAIIPYIVGIGWHISLSKKEVKVQKVELSDKK